MLSERQEEQFPIYGEWNIRLVDIRSGDILQQETGHNLVTISGRKDVMQLILGLSGSNFIALGAGACSINPGVGASPDVNDTHLYYEFIGNATRKSLTSPLFGGSLTSADVVSSTFTDNNGNRYYWQCRGRGTYTGSSDGNPNQPFQEFGLFTSSTLPTTPSGTSGTMLNHFITNTPFPLTPDVILLVDTTLFI